MESENVFSRFTPPPAPPVVSTSDEALVTDARAGLTPAQMVERRLVSLLQSTPLPVSRLQAPAPRRPLS
jgi:hypothetical protein